MNQKIIVEGAAGQVAEDRISGVDGGDEACLAGW